MFDKADSSLCSTLVGEFKIENKIDVCLEADS